MTLVFDAASFIRRAKGECLKIFPFSAFADREPVPLLWELVGLLLATIASVITFAHGPLGSVCPEYAAFYHLYMNRCIILYLFLVVCLPGQTTQPPSSPAREGDAQWNVVKTYGRATTPSSVTDSKVPKPTREQRSQAFISQADQLKAFYTSYPSHPSAKEAKRLEALSLNHAAFNGDTAHESRRLQMIDEVRKDATIPARSRFEMVAWSYQVAISRLNLAPGSGRLAAQENASRQLIAEFPTVPDGYESLLAVARDIGPVQGPLILNDLVRMPLMGEIGMEARVLSGRYALVGKSFAPILAGTAGAALAEAVRGKAVIVYAWSSTNAASWMAAKRLARLAPRASLIGINLDTNAEEARRTAQKERLPGEQWIDGRGRANAGVVLLQLNSAPLVYLVDSAGIIRDVNALVGASEKLKSLGM